MTTISKSSLMIFLAICITASNSGATIYYDDGQTHNINSPVNDQVWVDYQAPGMYTTVNWFDGAISDYPIRGYEDSKINIFGGSITLLRTYNNSYVNVSGGTIKGSLYPEDNSQIDIVGGIINGSLYPVHESQVTISGGEIKGDVFASYNSKVNISGGSIGVPLLVTYTATITFNGSNFSIEGQPVDNTVIYSIGKSNPFDEPFRTLTGTLASGEPFVNAFRIGYGGRIVLIPEPATLSLILLGGIALAKRRKR